MTNLPKNLLIYLIIIFVVFGALILLILSFNLKDKGDQTMINQPIDSRINQNPIDNQSLSPINDNQLISPTQTCPEAWYINKMPAIIDRQDSGLPNEYLIINGQRTELTEVDLDWIRANCSIKGPAPVY